ncbi:MAG: YybH family protein [Steroidobacteraceae bacterium]
MPKLLLVCILGWLPAIATQAQFDEAAPIPSLILEQGVVRHAGIDSIYAAFSSGYQALNPAAIARLYTESAVYLAPGDNIQTGQQIEAIFARFFGRLKQRGSSAAISFRIVQRQVQEALAYDVGIYSLTITAADGSSRQDQGKFVTVATRTRAGAWELQVDSFSGLGNDQ